MNRSASPLKHPPARGISLRPFGAATLLVLALSLTGCPPSTNPPSTNPVADAPETAAVADALLTEKVRVRLLAKLGSDALGIRIGAEGHRIDLTGSVSQRSTQELAEEVAKSVRGVRRVRNRIDLERREGSALVRGVDEAEREVRDATLESRVKATLLGELGRRALDVEVEASDGVVSLRGWVPDRQRKTLALETAETVTGVEKVVDLIRVGLEE